MAWALRRTEVEVVALLVRLAGSTSLGGTAPGIGDEGLRSIAKTKNNVLRISLIILLRTTVYLIRIFT
jgi:hypothetical protein